MRKDRRDTQESPPPPSKLAILLLLGALLLSGGANAQSINASVWLEQSGDLIRGCGDDDEEVLRIRASGGFFYCLNQEQRDTWSVNNPGRKIFTCGNTSVNLHVADEVRENILQVNHDGTWRDLGGVGSGEVTVPISGSTKHVRVRAKPGVQLMTNLPGGITGPSATRRGQQSISYGPPDTRLRYRAIEHFVIQMNKSVGVRNDYKFTGTNLIGSDVSHLDQFLIGEKGVRMYVVDPNPNLPSVPRQKSTCTPPSP